jgi:uncharacterized membrane protein YsdA (DUF1294 family)
VQNEILQTIIQILMLAANILSLTAFGADKLNSKRRGRRISESKLLLLAFFGPFGALAGMLIFRHKTRKIKFLLVPIFTIIQGLLLLWYFTPKLDIFPFLN